MRFRQDSIRFWETIVVLILFSLLVAFFAAYCFAIVMDEFRIGLLVCSGYAVVCSCCVFYLNGINRVWIFVDEQGILCKKKDAVLWQAAWSEVERLDKLTRYSYPAICIVWKDPPKVDLQIPANQPQYYFQYGRKAEEALNRYSPLPIVKR